MLIPFKVIIVIYTGIYLLTFKCVVELTHKDAHSNV